MEQPYHAPPSISVVTPTVDAGADEPTPVRLKEDEGLSAA